MTWASAIKKRDGNRCVVCGSSEKLEAHHIKDKAEHPEKANDVENGVTLCRKCHRAAHGGSFNKSGRPIHPIDANVEAVNRTIHVYAKQIK